MKINKKIIQKLNPCKNRFDNFLAHYPKFNGDLKDFILLENITYSDKVWVVTRLFTKEQNVRWSLLCASKVLSIFESKVPGDNRPRLALEACENYINDPSEENRQAAAAASAAASVAAYDAAAASASASSAAASAYSAASAAYSAAYDAAYSAVYSAAYDAAYSAAYDAPYSAASAAYSAVYDAKKLEEEVNLLLMVEAEGR